MDINRLKHKLRSIIEGDRVVAGVEVLSDDKGIFYHVAVLRRQKDEILFVNRWEEIRTDEKLFQVLGEETAVYFVFNIRGILHKQVEIGNEMKQEQKYVVPGIDPNLFYWQKTKMELGDCFSLVRKEEIDQILEAVSSYGVWVIGVNLGSYHIKHLVPLLKHNEEIAVTGFQLEFNEKLELRKIEKKGSVATSHIIRIGDEEFENLFLPSYAAAFKGLVVGKDDLGVPLVMDNKVEFFHRKLFKKASLAILSFLFVILAANTFFYFHFKSKNQEVKVVLAKKQFELSVLDSLEEELNSLEKIQLETNINHSSRSSFYADRIGASLPEGIQLKSMEIFPLKGKVSDYREGELRQYQMERILVKGYCRNSLVYNEWLQTLQSMDWVQKSEHLNYQEKSHDLKEFEMSILIVEP